MISQLSNIIVSYLIKHKAIENSSEDIEHYKYGIEITISSCLNIVLVLCIGIILKIFVYSVIFLIIFISVRHFTGGYHATTYFKCNLSLCVVFCLVSLSSFLLEKYINSTVITFHIILSSLIMTAFCPVANENKPIPSDSINKYKFIAICLSHLYSIIALYIARSSIIIESFIITTIIYINILVIVSQIIKKEGKT